MPPVRPNPNPSAIESYLQDRVMNQAVFMTLAFELLSMFLRKGVSLVPQNVMVGEGSFWYITFALSGLPRTVLRFSCKPGTQEHAVIEYTDVDLINHLSGICRSGLLPGIMVEVKPISVIH